MTRNEAQKILKEYKENEEMNFHSENLLLLAKTFLNQPIIDYCIFYVKSKNESNKSNFKPA